MVGPADARNGPRVPCGRTANAACIPPSSGRTHGYVGHTCPWS